MASLVLLQGGETTTYALTGTEMVVGRHPDCGVQLQSNMVSRKHACLFRDGDQYFVEDLGSGNGTFVNGKKIEARTPLRHGDRIKLGPILLRYEADGDAQHSGLATADTSALQFDIAGDADDLATITGTVQHGGGFGMLEARPAAKLKGVLEISRSLCGTVDLETLLPKVLETLFNIFPQADRGCILLKDPATARMIPTAQKHRRHHEDATVKLSRTVLNRVLEEKSGILSADAASDTAFAAAESIASLTIRSMMCAPLLSLDGEPIGIIHLDTNDPTKLFRQDDLELLMAVAGQAALCYENARLVVSFMEKLKQDSEMQIARHVQQSLLPERLPQAEGYEFYASYDSALAVGGDYYDAFLLGEGRVCLSFGDVAGKGVPASLVMSRIASVVQSTLPHVSEVGRAAGIINNHMCASAVEGRFVTYLLAVLDTQAHEMSLAIAGHNSPLIRRTDGTIEEFEGDVIGVPLGVMEDYPYEVVRRPIAPGEVVLFYTDGVSEAMNPAGDLYGEEQIREFVRTRPSRPEELGRALLADVRRHAAGRPQNDDITIMTFGRLA